eukprot:8601006-Heterocapsa_arctica.AAC.1
MPWRAALLAVEESRKCFSSVLTSWPNSFTNAGLTMSYSAPGYCASLGTTNWCAVPEGRPLVMLP